MFEYNDTFDFNTIAGAHGMPGSLGAVPTTVMDQSGSWNAAPYALSGLMEGGTAAPLHAQLDCAPAMGAKSNGSWGPKTSTCAVCLSTFQNAFGLDNHAKEAIHQAYKCKCGTSFNKHSALKRHIATKDAPKTFACTLCYDKFARKDKLKDHYRHYHKVTDEGLRALFNAQDSRPRGTASHRRRAPVPLAAAPPGPAATQAPAPPPAVAPAPAGPSIWSPTAYTGQQHANFSADFFGPADLLAATSPFVPTGPFSSSGAFVPAADPFAATAVPGEETTGTLDDIFGGAAWTTDFGGFNF